jgi:hypothetical protein
MSFEKYGKQMNKQIDKGSKFGKWIESHDMYASPITLTYNRSPKFTTVPGGICSIITGTLIVTFFCLKIFLLLRQSGVQVKVSSEIYLNSVAEGSNMIHPDLHSISDLFNITTNNATLAFKLSS